MLDVNRAGSACVPGSRCTTAMRSRSAFSAPTARRRAPRPWRRSAGLRPGRTVSSWRGLPTRPASISSCRSAAGRATAARATSTARPWRPITWACGLLGATKRITVFGTVHAPLFHPLIAAKEFVTADHIGEGRFGLNIVAGWNEGEFEMFGVEQRAHDERYEFAQEWIDGGQSRLVRRGGAVRFRRPLFQAQRGAGEAEALRRHAAADHERRALRRRAGASPCATAMRSSPRPATCGLPPPDRAAGCSGGTSDRSDGAKGRGDQGRGGKARPRRRSLHPRPGDLPADAKGGRGLSPLRQCRAGGLGGGRADAGASRRDAARTRRRPNMPPNDCSRR